MIRSLTASSLAAAALGFAWLCPAQAHAQACETDADCAQGLVCEVVGAIACAVPDCPPGEECPEPEPCEPEEFRECVPGPCTSDADCGEGLKCLSVSSETCTGSAMACDPDDEECVVVEVEPVCETVTEQYCAPDWVGECEADADCGEGFTCVAAEICECSSGERSDEAEPGVEVSLRVEPLNSHVLLTIESVKGDQADSVAFLNIPLTLKGRPDESFGSCALSLNLITRFV